MFTIDDRDLLKPSMTCWLPFQSPFFVFFFCHFVNLDLNKLKFFLPKIMKFSLLLSILNNFTISFAFFLWKAKKQAKWVWDFIFDFYFLGIKLLKSFIFLKSMIFNWLFFFFQSFSDFLNCIFSFARCEAEKLLFFNILAHNVIFWMIFSVMQNVSYSSKFFFFCIFFFFFTSTRINCKKSFWKIFFHCLYQILIAWNHRD